MASHDATSLDTHISPVWPAMGRTVSPVLTCRVPTASSLLSGDVSRLLKLCKREAGQNWQRFALGTLLRLLSEKGARRPISLPYTIVSAWTAHGIGYQLEGGLLRA